MTTITKQFTDINDALWWIDDQAGYVKMDEHFKVELVIINRKFRVTIETEAE
jgi:hypothetical protein